MNFPETLTGLINPATPGAIATRGAWKDPGRIVFLQRLAVIPMAAPFDPEPIASFLAISVEDYKGCIPWTPNQEDLLATDWEFGS
jgi:hypothetical protein